MMKIPSILQFCCHHRNKSTKPIIRLLCQFKFATQQSPRNPNSTFARLPQNTTPSTKTSNFSTATFLTTGTNTSEPATKTSNCPTTEPTTSEYDPQTQPSQNDQNKNEELLKIIKFLKSKGCSTKDIKDKCLPYIGATHSSYMKLLLVSELYSDVPLLMPLMSCSLSSLRMAAKIARFDRDSEFPDRITYLSQHLETPPSALLPVLAKHASLLTMQFDRLERKMDTLRSAGISPKHILMDLWIFNYKEELLTERIAVAKRAGVELKPWMLRCSMKTFKLIIEKNSETQSVLKGEDEMSYLARRLDCGKEYVEFMMERNTMLRAIAIPKLAKVLNFLYEKGYTPAEVRLFPRVFCSSVQTLTKRYNELFALKATLPTISQLCVKSRKNKTDIQQKGPSE